MLSQLSFILHNIILDQGINPRINEFCLIIKQRVKSSNRSLQKLTRKRRVRGEGQSIKTPYSNTKWIKKVLHYSKLNRNKNGKRCEMNDEISITEKLFLRCWMALLFWRCEEWNVLFMRRVLLVQHTHTHDEAVCIMT